MEIKKGQWIRTNDNIIDKIKFVGNGFNNEEDYLFTLSKNDLLQFSNYKNQLIKMSGWKTADTPQELVQKGDLVKIDDEYCIPLVIEVSNVYNNIIETQVETVLHNHIVAIYTKDNQGNYIKQWEMKQ